MTQDRELAEVLALLEKATPGEWRVYGRGNYGHGEEGSIETADGRDIEPAVSPAYDAPTIRGEVMLSDAEAIAAAVNFLRKHGPALLSRTPAGEVVDMWREAFRHRVFNENIRQGAPITVAHTCACTAVEQVEDGIRAAMEKERA